MVPIVGPPAVNEFPFLKNVHFATIKVTRRTGGKLTVTFNWIPARYYIRRSTLVITV